MRNFAKDIRFALRTLANNPGFAVIGIVTLALGMAANTTVFSVVNGFLLRPLPVPHPEQITVLALKQSSVAGTYRFSYPTYGDLRDQTGSFSDVFAFCGHAESEGHNSDDGKAGIVRKRPQCKANVFCKIAHGWTFSVRPKFRGSLNAFAYGTVSSLPSCD